MANKQKSRSGSGKNVAAIRMLIVGIAIVAVAVVFIVFSRGYINYNNRMDFIARRLEAYPSMRENHLSQLEQMQSFSLTSEYNSLARQAAFLYDRSDPQGDEAEKLRRITETLGVTKVRIIPASGQDSTEDTMTVPDMAFAPLADGRLIALEIENSSEFRDLCTVWDSYFMNRIEAGMPGYTTVISSGELSICPHDETSDAVGGMVQTMIDTHALNIDELKARATQSENGVAFQDVQSIGTDLFPQGCFVLRFARYADTDDIVVSVVRREELYRYGSGSTWCLAVLTLAVFVFLWMAIRHTDLHTPDVSRRRGLRIAFRRCAMTLIAACVVLLICVAEIQMISTVDQSKESTASSVDYLRSILKNEAERADVITSKFDAISQKRADTAAKILSGDPQLINLDDLRDLDTALDGIGLQVSDTSGKLIASDDLYHRENTSDGPKTEQQERIYHAPLVDQNAQTTGFVTFHVSQSQLDSMLESTRTEEVLSDTHLASELIVVAVDKDDRQTITAGSVQTWIGDSATDRGIPSQVLYDGYESVVTMEGNQVYGMIFSYENSLILVASRNVSWLVSIVGIAIPALVLILLLIVFYFLTVSGTYALQTADVPAEPREAGEDILHKPVRVFLRNMLITLFALSAVIYLITGGDSSSLAYKIVHGQWTHTIHVGTVTTLLMMISMTITIYTILWIILKNFSRRLTPRGRTICQMINSASHYIGTIILIVFALSMFGVNTTTLLGGAGIIALMFTFGANSMISDVLAGLFIIFEGSIMVGDVVQIGDTRGKVTDISMRTIKLMDQVTQEITVISNSQVNDFVKRTVDKYPFYIDIKLGHEVGLVKGEKIVLETLSKLPERCPEIIEKPQYIGVVELPERNRITGIIDGITLRVLVICRELDKEFLPYKIRRELVWVAHQLLNDDTQIGIEGCKIVEPLDTTRTDETQHPGTT